MKTAWRDGVLEKSGVAPVSLIVSAFAPVDDVRRTLTPALQLDERPTSLWLIDLAGGRNRLGASALAQVYGELGEEPADLDEPQRLTRLAAALAQARAAGMLRAYHDRSDGGLFVTLLEMAFAGHCGLDIALPAGRGGPAAGGRVPGCGRRGGCAAAAAAGRAAVCGGGWGGWSGRAPGAGPAPGGGAGAGGGRGCVPGPPGG